MKENCLVSTADVSVRYFVSQDDVCGDFCHDRFEIVFCPSFDGTSTVEGKQVSLSSGGLMLINPFAYHKIVSGANNGCAVWSVLFSKKALSDATLQMFDEIIGSGDDNGRIYRCEDLSAFASVFENFKHASGLEDDRKESFVSAILSQLIILLSLASGEGITHSDDCLGARVMRYLNINSERNVCLDKLAKHFFVSKYHLCRAFKEYSGISVHSYINRKRIMYARRLIESGETASHAAEKVGFGDYSAFYRAYIKIVGKSPTAEQREVMYEL